MTGLYINYLQHYQNRLDKNTDQKERTSIQNKIEDLKYSLSKTSKKKGKKSVSDAQLLSAYKNMLEAAIQSTKQKRTSYSSPAAPQLKRQVIKPLR